MSPNYASFDWGGASKEGRCGMAASMTPQFTPRSAQGQSCVASAGFDIDVDVNTSAPAENQPVPVSYPPHIITLLRLSQSIADGDGYASRDPLSHRSNCR